MPSYIGDGKKTNSGTGIAAGLRMGKLGLRLEGVTVEDILNEPDFFADLFETHKAIGFIDLHPTFEEHKAVMRALYRGDDPGAEFGYLMQLDHSSMPDKQEPYTGFSLSESEDFLMQNWHVDHCFEELVTSTQSIHMTKYDNISRGSTVLVDLEYLYSICPQRFKDYLEDRRVINGTGKYDAGQNIDYGSREHPALRTHPVTGNTSIFFTGMDTSPADGPSEIFDAYLAWVVNELAKTENRFEWSWAVGDLLVWDNRNTVHSLYGDWAVGDRLLNRGQLGAEAPYYDPTKQTLEVVNPDEEIIPANHDHIPLSLTRGIYGMPQYRHLENTVTLFIVEDEIPPDVKSLQEEINDDDFHVACISMEGIWGAYCKRHVLDDTLNPRFLFTRNGDLAVAYTVGEEGFINESGQPEDLESLIRGSLARRRDFRHAGHAWHYPDWMTYPTQQYRPWLWQNLSFMEYAPYTNDDPPPFDFLVQFAIDTVYGCFNHYRTEDERKDIIVAIKDFLDWMVQMEEYKLGR